MIHTFWQGRGKGEEGRGKRKGLGIFKEKLFFKFKTRLEIIKKIFFFLKIKKKFKKKFKRHIFFIVRIL